VDEFQSFANSTFANILSEARKYHLNLIIAHPYIAQMEEEVRDAVFGNVGTTITFRVGPFDAEILETVFTPQFLATDLVNLGFAQIYLSLMIDGVGSAPFSAQTLPPLERPPVSCRDMVIGASQKIYARKRADIEKIVADLHTPSPKGEGDKKVTKKATYPPNSGGNYPTKMSSQQRPVRRSEEGEMKRTIPKPLPPEKKPEDLRAILSKLSQSDNTTKTTIRPKEATTTSPAKDDLKNVLATMMSAQTAIPSTPIQPKPQVPVIKTPPIAQPAETKIAPTFLPTEAPSARLRQTPQFNQSTTGPDEQVVRQMLRPEKHERSAGS
ncbi:MAG: hypothetical protein AAB618_01995, partial [Patescibacteria group bacterium]